MSDNRIKETLDRELAGVRMDRHMIRQAAARASRRTGRLRFSLTAGVACAAMAALMLTFRAGLPQAVTGSPTAQSTQTAQPAATDAQTAGPVIPSALTRFYSDGKVGFKDASGSVVIDAVFALATDFNEYGVAVAASGADPSARLAMLGPGGLLTGFDFDAVGQFAYSLAPVCVGGKWGYADANGKIAVQPQYEHARAFACGLAAVAVKDGKKTKWGFIDVNGNLAVKPVYHTVTDFADDGTAIVRTLTDPTQAEPSGLVLSGVVDTKGNVLLPVTYYHLSGAWQGIRVASPVDGKDSGSGLRLQGLIDAEGNWIVQPQYVEMGEIQNGLVAAGVIQGGLQKTGLLRVDGTWQIKPKHQSIWQWKHGLIVFSDMLEGHVQPTMALYDEHGNPLLGGETHISMTIVSKDLVWCVDSDNGNDPFAWAMKTTDGRIVMPETMLFAAYEAADNCAVVSAQRPGETYGLKDYFDDWFNGSGIMNADGWRVQPRYNRIFAFDGKSGRGAVIIGEKSDDKTVTYVVETFDAKGNVLERTGERSVPAAEYVCWAYAESNYNTGGSAINRMTP